MAHSKEQSKLTEIIPEDIYTLDLLHKDFKIAVLNNFKPLKENMDKNLKETRKMMYEQNEISIKKLLKGIKQKF